jgi:hypothetical protein
MSKYKKDNLDEKKSPYSAEFREHSEKDWIAFRKGESLSKIVPPPNGWVNEHRQNVQWEKRKVEYIHSANKNINTAEEIRKSGDNWEISRKRLFGND